MNSTLPTLSSSSALGEAVDGEEAPVRLVDRLFQAGLQVAIPAVRVGGGDEVIDEPEEVGAVAGTHQLHGGLRFRAAEVEGLATGGIGLAALAGAQGLLPWPAGFFRREIHRFVHEAECVERERPIKGKSAGIAGGASWADLIGQSGFAGLAKQTAIHIQRIAGCARRPQIPSRKFASV